MLFTNWIKTQTAQKLVVRVKFTGNPYSYVCERPPMKYTQTRVCWNSYAGTCTVPDSYLCLWTQPNETIYYLVSQSVSPLVTQSFSTALIHIQWCDTSVQQCTQLILKSLFSRLKLEITRYKVSEGVVFNIPPNTIWVISGHMNT